MAGHVYRFSIILVTLWGFALGIKIGVILYHTWLLGGAPRMSDSNDMEPPGAPRESSTLPSEKPLVWKPGREPLKVGGVTSVPGRKQCRVVLPSCQAVCFLGVIV